MHHAKTTLVVLSLSLAGCASTHEPLEATTGVYGLTVSGELDACSPARTTGPMGTSGVVQQGTVLSVSMPDLTTSLPMLLILDGESGFSTARTESLDACAAASLSRTFDVVDHDVHGFDVAYSETWTGLSSCGAAARTAMPAAPRTDCRADLVFHYRLEAPCAPPCTVRITADGSGACRC